MPQPDAAPPPSAPEPSRTAFISHSHLDLKLAEKVSRALSTFGLSGYLAHRDLQSGAEWLEEIHQRLRESAVLVAILTPNFVDSDWTDHEVGFAVGREVPIVPIDAGVRPYGFMAHIQGLPWGDESKGGSRPGGDWSWSELADRETKLGKALELRKVIGHKGFITSLARSSSFHGTRVLLPLLGPPGGISDEEVRFLASAAAANRDIWDTAEATGALGPLFEQRRQLFSPELVGQLQKVHLLA